MSNVLESKCSQDHAIAIIGIAGTFGSASDLSEFWQDLKDGRSLVTQVPGERFADDGHPFRDELESPRAAVLADFDCFDEEVFGVSPRDAARMDPQHRLFLQIAWLALENAGYRPSSLAGDSIGVFAGAGLFEYSERLKCPIEGSGKIELRDLFNNLLTNQVSNFFDFHGPSEVIQTACSSSLVAIHRAVMAIRAGECDMALAGGANLLLEPAGFVALSEAGVISASGHPRVFDHQGDGFVRGEGVGAILLKSLAQAREDKDHIQAVILGSAINHNGRAQSLLAQAPIAQADVVRKAYLQAGIDPSTVHYLEVQGAGLPVADAREVNSIGHAMNAVSDESKISSVSGSWPCVVSCLKPNIGHAEAAAGIAAVLKVVLAMQHKRIPGVANLETVSPCMPKHQPRFEYPSSSVDWPQVGKEDSLTLPLRAGINGYGYGGVNAHLVLESAETRDTAVSIPDHDCLFLFSGADPDHLAADVRSLRRFLETEEGEQLGLADLAFTLQVGREALSNRWSVTARTKAELMDHLDSFLDSTSDWKQLHAIASVRDPNEFADFGNDPEDAEFLDSLWRAGKLTKVAKFWLSGASIPWEQLSRTYQVRRIPLPIRSFRKRHHWIDRRLNRQRANTESSAEMKQLSSSISSVRTSRQAITSTAREVLGMPPHGETHQDPIEGCTPRSLGLDSLRAMDLCARLSSQWGIPATVNQVLGAQTIGRLVDLLPQLPATPTVHRELAIAPEDRFKPFPLTEIQLAYYLGRTDLHWLGGNSCHLYWEFENSHWDIPRLQKAWNELIARHDMLRAVFLDDGQQVVLPEVPEYEFEIHDWQSLSEKEIETRMEAIRQRMSHERFPADQWPLFRIEISGSTDRMCLHFSFDLLIADATSIAVLFREWRQCYRQPAAELPQLSLSFRDVALQHARQPETDEFKASWQYWMERIDQIPPAPDLTLIDGNIQGQTPTYRRHAAWLDSDAWSALKERAIQRGLTPSTVLATAFSEVLLLWSQSSRFTLNVTVSRRPPIHPQINDLVGEFTSNILLEIDFEQGLSFEQRAAQLGERLRADLDHVQVSAVRLLDEMSRRRGKAVLMPVVFTSFLGFSESEGQSDLFESVGSLVHGVTQTPQVWLDAQVAETSRGLYFSWDVVESLFEAGLIERMFAAYRARVEQLATDEECWQRTGCELPRSETQARRVANQTERPRPTGLLHHQFIERARQHPDRIAVISEEVRFSYGELAMRAQALADQLVAAGAEKNQLVAIVMDKGWQQVVGVLGTLMAGAAYLPISVDLPLKRVHELLMLGEVRIAVTQDLIPIMDWPQSIIRIPVSSDFESDAFVRQSGKVHVAGDGPAAADDLAYVIFTSGSTGTPKGVMVTHQAALNTIDDLNDRYGVQASDRVLAVSSLGFDLSVYDLFGMLAVGGAIVMPSAQRSRDPMYLAQLIDSETVTLWNSVPSYLQLLVEGSEASGSEASGLLANLRLILLSGDWIPVQLPLRIKQYASRAQVVSLGGATEASIWSIHYPIDEVNSRIASIPYGKPLANQRFHVLNSCLDDCPVGVPGELYIGGFGLAEGYWRDEERTRASFITRPQTGERLYRTGDWGRYLQDGNIEFLGRQDSQVKVGGHRIELGEVDSKLNECPSVRCGAAFTWVDRFQQKRLAAAYVPSLADVGVSDLIKQFMQSRLPAYMVPDRWLPVSKLPLNANGKIDRHACAAMLDSGTKNPQANTAGSTVSQVESEVVAPLADSALTEDEVYIELLTSPEILHDPVERDEFVKRQPGLRFDLGSPVMEIDGMGASHSDAISIPESLGPHPSPMPIALTQRDFADGLTFQQVSAWLACLRELPRTGQVSDHLSRFTYPSAGSLYAVQTYLHIRGGRCEGLAAGYYYYHPVQNAIFPIAVCDLPTGLHLPSNQAAYNQSAFSLFLTADLSVVSRLYGSLARDFCLIEAGAMLQLLRSAAPSLGLGICPVGYIPFATVRQHLRLDDTHVLLHSLVGGALETGLDSKELVPAAEGLQTVIRSNQEQCRPEADVCQASLTSAEDLERRVAEIWAKVLELKQVGFEDNFFEIGGSSFAVLQVQKALVDDIGIRCGLVALFQHSTVRSLARYLSTEPSQKDEVTLTKASVEPNPIDSGDPRRQRRRAIRNSLAGRKS